MTFPYVGVQNSKTTRQRIYQSAKGCDWPIDRQLTEKVLRVEQLRRRERRMGRRVAAMHGNCRNGFAALAVEGSDAQERVHGRTPMHYFHLGTSLKLNLKPRASANCRWMLERQSVANFLIDGLS